MRLLRFFFIIMLFLSGISRQALSQEVRMTLWNFYLEKLNISHQLTPVEGFCFKASRSIRGAVATKPGQEQEVNRVYLILQDASTDKKYLCSGEYNEEIRLYNLKIRPEDEVQILSTEKNFFSPNICKMRNGDGMPGTIKFSRDRLLIFDEEEKLVGEFQGTLVSNDGIEMFFYDRLIEPEKEKNIFPPR